MEENRKTINQKQRRENLYAKTWKKPKFRHLTEVEIQRIREMREDGDTFAYIAQVFNRSIRTIEKHTKNLTKTDKEIK